MAMQAKTYLNKTYDFSMAASSGAVNATSDPIYGYLVKIYCDAANDTTNWGTFSLNITTDKGETVYANTALNMDTTNGFWLYPRRQAVKTSDGSSAGAGVFEPVYLDGRVLTIAVTGADNDTTETVSLVFSSQAF